MRETVKRFIETALTRTGMAAVARRRLRDHVLVLAYHDIVPDGDEPVGERSLHLPQRRFAEQLDQLQQHLEVIPLDSLGEDAARSSRPRAVITFDDAYRGAVTAGAAELVRRGLPATIFVAPDFIGGRSFWWDELTRPGDAMLDAQLRAQALQACRGEDEAVRRWAQGQNYPNSDAMPPFARAASEDELYRATSSAGGAITLGSHSWGHPNLSVLTEAELESELRRPLTWLRTHFPAATVPWLSYPYGLQSPAVRRAAAAAGYCGALLIEGGWVRRRQLSPFAIPRLNIAAGISANGFALRTAGLIRS